jgi:hypothetical protein
MEWLQDAGTTRPNEMVSSTLYHVSPSLSPERRWFPSRAHSLQMERQKFGATGCFTLEFLQRDFEAGVGTRVDADPCPGDLRSFMLVWSPIIATHAIGDPVA